MSARPAADRLRPTRAGARRRTGPDLHRRRSHPGRPRPGRDALARDRTDIEALTRQLDAVQTMGSALRAQRHEFANRLHVVHGLLDQGHLEEATDYVRSVLVPGRSAPC